jgi:hypothetical protein
MSPTKILVVERDGDHVAYDLYEMRDEQQVAHGVIDLAGESTEQVIERLRARFGEHSLVVQYVVVTERHD